MNKLFLSVTLSLLVFLVAPLFAPAVFIARAENGGISGIVYDSLTGEALSRVLVATDVAGSPVSTLTLRNGGYLLLVPGSPDPGTPYLVTYSKKKYYPQSYSVSVISGQTTHQFVWFQHRNKRASSRFSGIM